jgi:glucan phosphorylase
MEVGLEPEMPTYTGGLGVLAGHTFRATTEAI